MGRWRPSGCAQLRLVHEQVKALDRGIAALLQQLPAALGEVMKKQTAGTR